MAVVDDGAAAGEGDAGRIDKAAAVYLNAGGVGHNHFGAPAGHFDIAAQLRGVAAVDLVHNHPRFATGKPRVALYPAAGVGGGVAAAVVENRAFAVYVELAVLVDRHAGGSGRLDIDLRQAVGGLQNGGLLIGRCGFVGGNAGSLRGHNPRLPKGEQQRETDGRQAQSRTGTCRQSGAGRAVLRGFACAGGVFGHGHHLAAFFVEDHFIEGFVHDALPVNINNVG